MDYEKDVVREQLYKAMNNDNYYIKNLIVQHLSRIKESDEDIYRNIVELGLHDTNFLVRNNTKKALKQLEETV